MAGQKSVPTPPPPGLGRKETPGGTQGRALKPGRLNKQIVNRGRQPRGEDGKEKKREKKRWAARPMGQKHT